MTANAGYHAYATGDVLTAAQVQYNLQNQTVMYFADTTARDAALTGAILVEGMVSYTPATGLMYYNGTTWVSVSGASVPTSYGFTAGKNKIINGDFGVWQRGTSFDFSSNSGYTSDRWALTWNGTGATRTISQQTFTPGAAPVSGYEGTYFFRYNQSVAGSGGSGNYFYQPIEDVRIFAGQTVTVSFWAKADASRSVSITLGQNFGTGGSSQVTNTVGTASLTTSWVRYTYSVAIPSISGKTIGTNSSLQLTFTFPANVVQTIDFWGVQLEAGSSATSFQTATGTVQGELAACQRYYQVIGGTVSGFPMATFYNSSASQTNRVPIIFPVQMRIAPTMTKNGTWGGNAGQPSAGYISSAGFSFMYDSGSGGMNYIFPDSTDDTFTSSAEL
jgi:hypothetical protein